MPFSRYLRFVATLLIAILYFVVGCSTAPGLKDELPKLIGVADKSYFANRFGPPDKQAAIGQDTEMWEYHIGEQKYTSKTGYRFSTFDELRLTFKNGHLVEWSIQGRVQ